MSDSSVSGYAKYRVAGDWPVFRPIMVYLRKAKWDETVSTTTFTFLWHCDEWPDRTVAIKTDWK